jgi:hypothetical protein
MKPVKVWLMTFGFVAALGCTTINTTPPLPCREIHEVPGLHEEMLKSKETDEYGKQFNVEPRTEKLRRYIIESSAKCKGNKHLR